MTTHGISHSDSQIQNCHRIPPTLRAREAQAMSLQATAIPIIRPVYVDVLRLLQLNKASLREVSRTPQGRIYRTHS